MFTDYAVPPMTLEELDAISTPAFLPGVALEGYRKTYFDTADLATGSTELRFFNQPRAGNPQATNLDNPGSGQLPTQTFFRIREMFLTVLIPSDGDAADPTVWSDIAEIIMGHDGWFNFTNQNKEYGPWRICEAGAIGGLTGYGYNLAAVAATAREHGQNGRIQVGIPVDGSLWILPKASFRISLTWDAAITLEATRRIGIDLRGDVYRPIR